MPCLSSDCAWLCSIYCLRDVVSPGAPNGQGDPQSVGDVTVRTTLSQEGQMVAVSGILLSAILQLVVDLLCQPNYDVWLCAGTIDLHIQVQTANREANQGCVLAFHASAMPTLTRPETDGDWVEGAPGCHSDM